MTARVDKTESAVGVTRGILNADIVQADWGKVIGVSIASTGKVVRGTTGGTSGLVGVIIADKTNYKASSVCDIFKLGEIIEDTVVFTAGAKYYAAAADGLISTTVVAGNQVGFTVETDRLVVAINA
jgi:hypothetical protein